MADDNGILHTQGFVFAFLRFSNMRHRATWIQRFVHMMTASDIIHVAIVPVRKCQMTARRVLHAVADPHAFTAFIGNGYEIQDARAVLHKRHYELIFLPVHDMEAMERGIDFLHSLEGARYNYRALPLTMLPRALKRHRMPNWFTQEEGLSQALAPHHWAEQQQQRHGPDLRVFCSQMGLMLCYVCDVLQHYIIDPAGCAPGELAKILREQTDAVPCEHTAMDMSLCGESEADEASSSSSMGDDHDEGHRHTHGRS